MIMKKLLIFALAVFAFVACKKDDDNGPAGYNLTVVYGTIDGEEGRTSGTFFPGEKVTVVADEEAPLAGQQFAMWDADRRVDFRPLTGETTTFTMPAANVTVEAVFELPGAVRGDVYFVDQWGNTAHNSEALQFSMATPGNNVPAGVWVYLETGADFPGYKFSNVWESEQVDIIWDEYDLAWKFQMPASDVTVTPIYEEVELTVEVYGKGFAFPATSTITDAKVRSTITVERTTDRDLYLEKWACLDNTDVEFTVNGDQASFMMRLPDAGDVLRVGALYGAVGESPYILFLDMDPGYTVEDDIARFANIGSETHFDSHMTKTLSAGQYNPSTTYVPGKAMFGNQMFFKFGGLIGFTFVTSPRTTGANAFWPGLDGWSFGDIAFDPSNVREMGPNPTHFYQWNAASASIPCFNNDGGTDNPNHVTDPEGNISTDGFISSDDYNTLENMELGRGDVCRLAGLTATEAKAMIADGSIADYISGLRLPKESEMSAMGYVAINTLTGGDPGYDHGSMDSQANVDKALNTGMWIPGDPTSFIPNANYRSSGGNDTGPTMTFMYCSYWTSKPDWGGNKGGRATNWGRFGTGFATRYCRSDALMYDSSAVRCVPLEYGMVPDKYYL